MKERYPAFNRICVVLTTLSEEIKLVTLEIRDYNNHYYMFLRKNLVTFVLELPDEFLIVFVQP